MLLGDIFKDGLAEGGGMLSECCLTLTLGDGDKAFWSDLFAAGLGEGDARISISSTPMSREFEGGCLVRGVPIMLSVSPSTSTGCSLTSSLGFVVDESELVVGDSEGHSDFDGWPPAVESLPLPGDSERLSALDEPPAAEESGALAV